MFAFSKINKKFNVPVTLNNLLLIQELGTKDKKDYKYTNFTGDKKIASIKFYDFDAKQKDIILQNLPLELLNIETPTVWYMEVEKETQDVSCLPIHVDRGRRCSLNIYTKCNDEETCFYDNLGNKISSFVAKENDVWLLDVSKPHSVNFNSAKIRRGITLSFKHASYAKIKDILPC
jgi:hypothetical protein